MKHRRIIVGVWAAAALAAGAACAQFPYKGYLEDAAPDTTAIVPPAPLAGSPLAEADRAIYRSTRALMGSPRWQLAITDLDERKVLDGLRCAIGAEITMTNSPKLTRLLIRVAPDLTRAVDRPKAFYARKRPYLVDEGEICTERSAALADSPDYPSGHASWSWAVGLILADLAPDRAGPILQRARAFGESRVVCGVHTASAVAAGRTNGAAVVAALHGSAEFRQDLETARAELAALRAQAEPPKDCAAEAETLATPAW